MTEKNVPKICVSISGGPTIYLVATHIIESNKFDVYTITGPVLHSNVEYCNDEKLIKFCKDCIEGLLEKDKENGYYKKGIFLYFELLSDHEVRFLNALPYDTENTNKISYKLYDYKCYLDNNSNIHAVKKD